MREERVLFSILPGHGREFSFTLIDGIYILHQPKGIVTPMNTTVDPQFFNFRGYGGNILQNSGTVMNFQDHNKNKNKNGEQLKHRNIMNEIL